MKHLLVVHPDDSVGAALPSVLSARRDGLSFHFVSSLDAARPERVADQVFEEFVPRQHRAILRDAVAWSRARPESPW